MDHTTNGNNNDSTCNTRNCNQRAARVGLKTSKLKRQRDGKWATVRLANLAIIQHQTLNSVNSLALKGRSSEADRQTVRFFSCTIAVLTSSHSFFLAFFLIFPSSRRAVAAVMDSLPHLRPHSRKVNTISTATRRFGGAPQIHTLFTQLALYGAPKPCPKDD